MGGVALLALLSSSSWLHALKSPEEIEKEEVSHARCVGQLTLRETDLKILEKNALTGELKAHRKYLKKVGEFLKEDPSYRPVTMGSDESPATFFKNLHTQALKNLSDSLLPSLEKSFEKARLKLFYYLVGFSGETEESAHREIKHSLQCIPISILRRRKSFTHTFIGNC